IPLLSCAAALVFVAGAFIYGSWRVSAVEKLEQQAQRVKVGLAQPNVGEGGLHYSPRAPVRPLPGQTASLYARGAELVIWPEGGFNTRAVELGDPSIGHQMQAGVPVPIIAGVLRVDGNEKWNSAGVVNKDGTLGDHFDKINLLAFGEYIPFGKWFPIVYKWSPMSSEYSRGESTAPLRIGRRLFATFICYEDILPALVRKTIEDHGNGRADAMVNLTNDSWYGAGHEQ